MVFILDVLAALAARAACAAASRLSTLRIRTELDSNVRRQLDTEGAGAGLVGSKRRDEPLPLPANKTARAGQDHAGRL